MENIESIFNNGNKINDSNDDNILLSKFQEISNIFFKLYIFKKNIKKISSATEPNKEKNNIFSSKCYIIKKTWFKAFKNFYLCEELFKVLETAEATEDDLSDPGYKKAIINTVFNKHKNILIEHKSKCYNEFLVLDINNLKFNKTDVSLHEYEIISLEIFNDMFENNNINEKDVENEYIINNEKVILKFDNKTPFLVIGNLNNTNDSELFIFEKEYTYQTPEVMKEKFEYFKDQKYDEQLIKDPDNQTKNFVNIKSFATPTPTPTGDTQIGNSKNYTNNISNGNKISEDEEKEIKFLIAYYLNNLELDEKIKLSTSDIDNPFFIEECYLINKKLINEYKKKYNYDQLNNYINEILNMYGDIKIETKNLAEKSYENITNQIYEKLKVKNFTIEKNTISCQLEAAIINVEVKDNLIKSLNIPYSFEIINSKVYSYLTKIKDKKLKKYDGILKEGKIIFQFYDKENEKYLLINCIYEPSSYNVNYEEIIMFKNSDDLKQNFEDIKNRKYEIIKQEKFHDFENLFYNNQNLCKLFRLIEEFIDRNPEQDPLYTTLNNIQTVVFKNLVEINPETTKRIKFFIRLFFYCSEICYKINQPLTNQKAEVYYLVDKIWLDKYKKSYCYDNLIKTFFLWSGDEKIVKLIKKYNQNLTYYSNELLNDKFMDELFNYKSLELKNCILENNENINKENLQPNDISFDTVNDIQYYNNYEIFPKYMVDLLKSTESDLLENKNLLFQDIHCFFGENRIFLEYNLKQNFIIQVAFLNNNDFSKVTEMIIKDNDKKKILEVSEELRKKGFENLIYSLKFDINYASKINESTSAYLLVKYGKTFEAINSKLNESNKNLELVLKIMLFNEKIKEKINLPIKENFTNNNEKFEKLYLINVNWFDNFKKNSNYDEIYKLILNNQKLFELFSNKDLKDDEKIKEIIKHITLTETNKNTAYFSEGQIHVKSESITIRKNEKLLYYQNFVLVTQDILDLLYKIFEFNIRKQDAYTNCLFGDNKILLIIYNKYQYMVEICSIKNNNKYEIEMFLDYENSDDSENEKEIIKLINIGYDNYIMNNTFSQTSKNNISPIFNEQKMILGYAYKYDKNITDYSNYQTNYNLKILVMLYIYYEQLKIFIQSGNIDPQKLYLINKNWLQEYKSFYGFNKIIDEIKNNSILDNIIKGMKESKNIFDYSIDDKKIALIINDIDNKINTEINQKGEKNEFKNIHQEEPTYEDFNYINANSKKDSLKFYDNFELISKNIYSLLFFQKNKKISNYNSTTVKQRKNYYLECYSLKNKLFIKLPKTKKTEKTILELCKIDENNTFSPTCFFIYDNEEMIQPHISYILTQFRIDDYIFFHELEKNHSKIFYQKAEEDSHKLGEICLFYKNADYNDDNSFCLLQEKNNSIREEPLTTKFNSIHEEFPLPPLVGAQNVGATCYMNATIQCFSQIEKLVSYFKYDPNDKIKNIIFVYNEQKLKCLTKSFKNLIDNFWPSPSLKYPNNKFQHQNSNNKYFSPIEFKNTISEMDPLFAGRKANDSKDLVNFIIMTLHNELNETKISNDNRIIDQQNIVYNEFAEQSKKENNSIISDIFYAINGSIMQCSICQEIKINFQNYFFLTFPLEEVRKFKQRQSIAFIQNMMMNFQQNYYQMNQINSVTIYDCFEYYQQYKYLEGENSIHCKKCQCLRNAQYKSFLVTCPNILIVALNSGIEFNIKLEFDEKLSLEKYVDLNEEKKFNYNLIGVVTHMGLSGATGHLIACCKSPIDKKWYKYNDDLVMPIDNVKEEVIDNTIPYILFYQKNE